MKPWQIHVLAFACGFISLAVEMWWVRYIGFAWQGEPTVFGFVLSAFLCGIAFGAWLGKLLCERTAQAVLLMRHGATILLLGAVFIVLTPAVYAYNPTPVFRTPVLFALIALNASAISVLFPIVHHLGVVCRVSQTTPVSRRVTGRHFSGVYCSNVAGAAFGPLVFGYVLLNWFSTQDVIYLLSALTAIVALVYLYVARCSRWRLGLLSLGVTAMLWGAFSRLPADSLLQSVSSFTGQPIARIIETRQGIVTLYDQPKFGDVVMGGNIYDGTTNTNLEINSNGLERPLLMMALHDKPKRVLMIGLSIGSWLALVREFPGVEHIDVVEINPGYVTALEHYPAQRAAIADPRVKLHLHDARRWLKLYPDLRYDAVLMNTTFHWRSNVTLLLSNNFLKILQTHLQPGGVLAFNATGSVDALRTAQDVFITARRYGNFIYAADWDFTSMPSRPEVVERYRAFKLAGKLAFEPGSAQPQKFLDIPFVDLPKAERLAGRRAQVITDLNMINEFRFGRP